LSRIFPLKVGFGQESFHLYFEKCKRLSNNKNPGRLLTFQGYS